jgi:hypothetical protein
MNTTTLKEINVYGTTWKVVRTYEPDDAGLIIKTDSPEDWIEIAVHQEGSRDVYRGYYNPVENDIALFDYPLDIESYQVQ